MPDQLDRDVGVLDSGTLPRRTMTRLWDRTITVNWPRLPLVEYASFGMSVRFEGTSHKWPPYWLAGAVEGAGRADEL